MTRKSDMEELISELEGHINEIFHRQDGRWNIVGKRGASYYARSGDTLLEALQNFQKDLDLERNYQRRYEEKG